MQDSGAHDLIVKSAVDFMFALAEGDYQQEVSLFVKICFNHASYLVVISSLFNFFSF